MKVIMEITYPDLGRPCYQCGDQVGHWHTISRQVVVPEPFVTPDFYHAGLLDAAHELQEKVVAR